MRPPKSVGSKVLSRCLNSAEPTGLLAAMKSESFSNTNAVKLPATEKGVTIRLRNNEVSPLLHYARRHDKVSESEGTTPRILYLGHWSASRPDALPTRKDPLLQIRVGGWGGVSN